MAPPQCQKGRRWRSRDHKKKGRVSEKEGQGVMRGGCEPRPGFPKSIQARAGKGRRRRGCCLSPFYGGRGKGASLLRDAGRRTKGEGENWGVWKAPARAVRAEEIRRRVSRAPTFHRVSTGVITRRFSRLRSWYCCNVSTLHHAVPSWALAPSCVASASSVVDVSLRCGIVSALLTHTFGERSFLTLLSRRLGLI